MIVSLSDLRRMTGGVWAPVGLDVDHSEYVKVTRRSLIETLKAFDYSGAEVYRDPEGRIVFVRGII